jgi:hypothetical protein
VEFAQPFSFLFYAGNNPSEKQADLQMTGFAGYSSIEQRAEVGGAGSLPGAA